MGFGRLSIENEQMSDNAITTSALNSVWLVSIVRFLVVNSFTTGFESAEYFIAIFFDSLYLAILLICFGLFSIMNVEKVKIFGFPSFPFHDILLNNVQSWLRYRRCERAHVLISSILLLVYDSKCTSFYGGLSR